MASKNKKTFDKIRESLMSPQRHYAEEVGKEAVRRVVEKTPYPPGFNPGSGKGPRTGNLKAGWKYKASRKEVVVSNDVEYAEYVNSGTEKMNGAFMVEKTINELDIISDVAYKRAKKK